MVFLPTKEFRAQMYFRHKWIDDRIAFNSQAYGGIEEVYIEEKQIKQLWLPDTLFMNAKSLHHHNSIFLSENANQYCLVRENGEIYLSKM